MCCHPLPTGRLPTCMAGAEIVQICVLLPSLPMNTGFWGCSRLNRMSVDFECLTFHQQDMFSSLHRTEKAAGVGVEGGGLESPKGSDTRCMLSTFQ